MSAEEKTNAFRLFDFENNEGWRDYLRRIDISGPGYNEKLLKLKAKWYKREVDADFDLAWLAKHATSNLNSSTSTAAENRGEQANEEPSEAPSGPSASASASTTRPAVSHQQPQPPLTVTALHFAILITGVVSLLPLCPRSVHRVFLQFVVMSSILKVGHHFGWPKLSPWSELKLWLSRVMGTTDCQYGFMALLFFRQIPTRLVFIPSTVLAAYHAFHYLNIRFSKQPLWMRYGDKAYQFMAARQNHASLLNAVSEIGTGFVLLLQLFTPMRNFLVTVMFWQWLKVRYWSNDSAAIHRQAWANIGRKADPFLKMIPILRIPINLVQRWFTQRPA